MLMTFLVGFGVHGIMKLIVAIAAKFKLLMSSVIK